MIKTTLNIDGMMCSMCEAHVNDCIRNNFKVKKVTSSHSRGECVIESAEMPDIDALKSALSATGYEVTGVKTENVERSAFLGGIFGKNKKT